MVLLFLISEYYDIEKLKVDKSKLKQYPCSDNENTIKQDIARIFHVFVKDLLSDQIFKRDYNLAGILF